ncbi:MAG: alpha-L-rhamnosidase C-terminal domain-containing protein, partial [Lacipirellulaceae bacterium]
LPDVTGPLTSASAELETPHGKASSSWKKIDGQIEMNITVPPNTTATIQFPDGRPQETVTAGMHRFQCQAPESE